MTDKNTEHSPETQSGKSRKRQKIRIKYRERVKIKKRKKESKVARYWRKKKKHLIANLIILSLLGITLFMVAKVVSHRVEMNKLEKDDRQKIPD